MYVSGRLKVIFTFLWGCKMNDIYTSFDSQITVFCWHNNSLLCLVYHLHSWASSENINLLCKGKYHCMADLFDWLGFNQTSKYCTNSA